MSKSPITCHVLDASTGKPAEGVVIRLQLLEVSKSVDGPDIFQPLAKGWPLLGSPTSTGSELALKEKTNLVAGQTYKIVFKTKEYSKLLAANRSIHG
ncbi:hypothetical protein BJ912DRAFT_213491 [Pholiota molesta]|nr:hypothetical protein BJ912DRAFT_213491 [Pholiota molesta]